MKTSLMSSCLPGMAQSLLIGDATTASTVGHLLALHVAIIGGAIVVVAFLHFFMFEKSGPFNLSDRKEEKETGKDEKYFPWYPVNLLYTFLALSLDFRTDAIRL